MHSLLAPIIRKMRNDDIAQVMEIEKSSFPEPYSEQLFIDELKLPCAHLWVVEYDKQIAGYIDYWVVHDEIELISIAVQPKFRRKKIGALLMQQMLDFAQTTGVHIIYLDVRESNAHAQQLYAKLGFTSVGLRKRYYKNNHENAIIMVKEL